MRKLVMIFLAVIYFTTLWGQTSKQEIFDTPEKTGGVQYAYPVHDIKPYTAPPKDYNPFYISHYSRHGSRYLVNDSDYKWILDVFEEAYTAKSLTPLGEDVYSRLQKVWNQVEGHGGDLSPLGVDQMRGIAERMYTNYPDIFSNGISISARSTLVVRCVLSMDAFCERLKELNTSLNITREASNKHMNYLCHDTKESQEFKSSKGPWREEYRKFVNKHVHPDRIINTLFSDSTYILKRINPESTMQALFRVASNMQNISSSVSFYDLFDKEELFDLWQCSNYSLYTCGGNAASNKGLMMNDAKPLLKNIINSANETIVSKNKSATLRFGHDGNITPLASLLHLEGCYASVSDPTDYYKVWSDFKVAPMAGNVQIIFYRHKKTDDIIVKFMLNENETLIPPVKSDILPYYKWKDIENFYNSIL
ncbi:histidine-type phosphatase [Dysgonomonas sp. Marseille-P4677]|uniref:histidine-type phosphatase n=1 Tax=Dysgonomonas sp. Marseille-P4677 TaxID=2364790 RepID=UPI0019127D06|nr:histidine-type phosphatase [Dysgonomonas sp. Marseille-P4677]MBK5721049.1 histidine-type phosphatase [Dysgonomonas sp. Marseille-P4677]